MLFIIKYCKFYILYLICFTLYLNKNNIIIVNYKEAEVYDLLVIEMILYLIKDNNI